MLSPSSSLLLLSKTITHPAARSLCDSWASCFQINAILWQPSRQMDIRLVVTYELDCAVQRILLCRSYCWFSCIFRRQAAEALSSPVVRPSVARPLTHISRDAIRLHLVEWFQWNLPQIFIMWMEIAEKVSRSEVVVICVVVVVYWQKCGQRNRDTTRIAVKNKT